MPDALFPTDPLSLNIAQFLMQSRNTLNQVIRMLQGGQIVVWSNPTGATPQQVCDALGTSAGGVFAAATAMCALIGSATGVTPNPTPAGWTVTSNADGTITLTKAS